MADYVKMWEDLGMDINNHEISVRFFQQQLGMYL